MLATILSIAYVVLCAIGTISTIVIFGSVTEVSYLLMQSRELKIFERRYFKKCIRFLLTSLLCSVLCVVGMDLLHPADTKESTLFMIIIIVFEFGFFLGICPPFLDETKRITPKRHLLS